MLPLLAIHALAMMAAAAGLLLYTDSPPQALAHIAFALGILPLILAAMAYFIPVLTRSGSDAPRKLQLIPLAAWLGGLILVTSLLDITPSLSLSAASHAAALLGLLATLSLLSWCLHRRRRTVGKPHPGLNWYLAALACLILALCAVPLMDLWPEQRAALRLLHLHLNLLGFVGLTAIGTLQVLLPTAAGRPDPQAAARLAGDLKYAFSGVLLLAAGAAWLPVLALPGGVLTLIAPVRMLHQWRNQLGPILLQRHGAPSALSALALASLGFIGMQLLGLGHGSGLLPGRPAIIGYIVAFLLPLVSGAATQLLPTWLRPGPQGAWHTQLRAQLGWQAGLRSALLVVGGLLPACGLAAGLWLALAGLTLLILAFLRAGWRMRPLSSAA
jgi:hypothetical protein